MTAAAVPPARWYPITILSGRMGFATDSSRRSVQVRAVVSGVMRVHRPPRRTSGQFPSDGGWSPEGRDVSSGEVREDEKVLGLKGAEGLSVIANKSRNPSRRAPEIRHLFYRR
jgi:hypothetical protein